MQRETYASLLQRDDMKTSFHRLHACKQKLMNHYLFGQVNIQQEESKLRCISSSSVIKLESDFDQT